MIDITDDITGSPHEVAQQHIAMYVNEIGHNNNLKQNVFIGEDYDRTVIYSIHLDAPLIRGESVELFTNYRSVYEQVRERKGYGRKNLSWGLKCDRDRASRFSRNFGDRIDAETLVHSDSSSDLMCDLWQLQSMIDFVHDIIWAPIFEYIKPFLASQNFQCSALHCQQWVALRRIYWLGENVFTKKLSALEEVISREEKLFASYSRLPHFEQCFFPYRGFVAELRKSVQEMMNMTPVVSIVERGIKLPTESGASVLDAIHDEIAEEILYKCRGQLPLPFDQALWCPVSQWLLNELCILTVPLRLISDEAKKSLVKQALKRYYFTAAENAASEVWKYLDSFNAEKALSFQGGLRTDKTILSTSPEKLLKLAEIYESFYFGYSTVPKCFLAAVLDELAYIDSPQVGDLAPQESRKERPLEHDLDFVMVIFKGFGTSIGQSQEHALLRSIPRSSSYQLRSPSRLNVTWYLVWQVFYPVYCFAQTFIKDYCLVEELCKAIKISPALAGFAIKGAFVPPQQVAYKRFLRLKDQSVDSSTSTNRSHKGRRKKAKIKCEKKKCAIEPTGRLGSSHSSSSRSTASRLKPLLLYEGPPDPKFLAGFLEQWPAGWIQRVFQRQSGSSRGLTDHYWYSPVMGYKLRSVVELKKFLTALQRFQNDENKAWSSLKSLP